MHADLERLIDLQRLDSAAQTVQRRLAEEPGRQVALDARIETARQHVAAAKEHLATNQNARREVEKELAVHQGRLSKFRDQLMAVKTNREYQAMQKEMEVAQSEIKVLEEKILERMLEADELNAATKRAESALAAEQKAVEADRRVMASELAELTASMTRIASDRAAVIASLDKALLSLFELVANKRNGVALSEAREGVCTICHVRLRPQVFNSVLRNDTILQCDHCNRILYFVPVTSPAAVVDNVSPPAQ